MNELNEARLGSWCGYMIHDNRRLLYDGVNRCDVLLSAVYCRTVCVLMWCDVKCDDESLFLPILPTHGDTKIILSTTTTEHCHCHYYYHYHCHCHYPCHCCDDWCLMPDDWWLMTDDWWLMTDDWWLMTDDWWLMADDWRLMTWCAMTNHYFCRSYLPMVIPK